MPTPQPGPALVVERPPLPTRISADPSHPWYDPRARQLHVFVNGRPLHRCTRADTVAGHAWAWLEDQDGDVVMEYGRKVERLHVGHVELRFRERAGLVSRVNPPARAPVPIAGNDA